MLVDKLFSAKNLFFQGPIWIVYGLNFLIGLFAWSLCYPGFYSSDSFSAVEIAKTGNLTNWGSLSWSFFVYYFSFKGQFIGVLTLMNLLILIYSTTYFSYEFFKEKLGRLVSIAFVCSPLVSGFGNTLWHDIPFTAGMLLISGALIKTVRVGSFASKSLLAHLVVSGFLITFRTNGIPTLFVFLIFIAVFYKFRGILYRSVLISLGSSIIFTIALTSFLRQTPINSVAAQEWMRSDISCYAATSEGAIFIESKLGSIGQLNKWASKWSCDGISQVKLTEREYAESITLVPKAWLDLAIQEPGFIFHTHASRNAYLLPIPLFGFNRTPFLHSTIEIEDKEIKWRTPSIAKLVRYPMRFANLFSFILCWVGFWTLLMLVFYFKNRRDDIKILLMAVVSLSSILFIAGPIADGRYTMFATMVGVSTLIRELYLTFQSRGERAK